MKILVINDDGIGSRGLWAAARALRRVGEVFRGGPGAGAERRGGVAHAALPR